MVAFPQPGGCLCGAIRLLLTEDPLTLYACHCTDCQRHTGTSFVLSMIARRQAVEVVSGEPSQYAFATPDGRQKRGRFCGRCSTRLWGEPVALPDLVALRPGILDDTSWVEPVAHIWTASAQRWIEIPERTLTFSGQPRGEEMAALVRAWKERRAPAGRAPDRSTA
jgi:hypothetical protein